MFGGERSEKSKAREDYAKALSRITCYSPDEINKLLLIVESVLDLAAATNVRPMTLLSISDKNKDPLGK